MVEKREVSRRSFLKLLGLVSVQANASLLSAPGSPLARGAGALWPASPAGQIPSPAAQLLHHAIDLLREQGFSCDPDQSSRVTLPGRPELLGVMLHDTRLPPHPEGASVALTVDLEQPERSSLHMVVGRSHSSALELRSTLLSVGGERRERAGLYTRSAPQSGAALRPSRHAAMCASAAGGESGDTCQEYTQWYYQGCDQTLWCHAPGAEQCLQLVYTSCLEYRNSRIVSTSNPRRTRSWQSEWHQSALD